MAAGRIAPSWLTFLLVCLPLCSVPVLADVIVNSLSVSFNDNSDQIVESSTDHRFDFDVTINLGPGDDANEDGNLARWSVSLMMTSGVTTCATPAVTLTPAQAGVAIPASGQGVMKGVTLTADLSGCLCSATGTLGLLVALSSTSYVLEGDKSITAPLICHGIVGSSLTLVTSGGLVENTDNQVVSLQIIANSKTQGRSVTCGGNCWAVTVYAATGTVNSPVAVPSTEVAATLSSGTGSSSWVAGGTLTLNGILATLDLRNKGSCNDLDLICTSLTRNAVSNPSFTIDGTSIVSCAPAVCTGVVINHVLPSFTSPTAINQGEDNTGIQLTVTIMADSSKASISGSNLWSANVFGNADSDCSNPTQVPGTVQLVDATDYGLDVNSNSIWPLIEVSLNLAQHSCNDARYICLGVLKGNNPTPDFTLSYSPESAKYGIIQVSCTGLTVDSGTLTVNPATQLAAFKEDHEIQFDISFDSTAGSAGVGGSQLWELVAFPAFNGDGSGQTGSETTVTLDISQLSTGFPGAGGTLSLSGLTATLSLVNNACNTYRYLCARLRKNSMASPDFVIQPAPVVCSSLLDCRNVILISTEVSASGGQSPNGLPLYEGVADQDVYFDVVIQSDATAGSVPSGTDHWAFVVNPGLVSADLTQAQKDKMLTAGEELTFSRVQATLDLTNTHCADLGDVCAEIRRSADDSLNFMLASNTAQNMGCFTPTCEGVEITSLSIQDGVTNFELKEGTQDHTLTFSVDVTTNADKGSVRGSGLWQMMVFLSSDSTNRNDVEALAQTGAWMDLDVLAGEDATFSSIQAVLDLDATCANMRFLCVQLTKATGQNFLLVQTSDSLQTCKPVPQCNGIEVESAEVGFRSGHTLVEGVETNSPVLDIALTFTDTSASVTGTDIWSVEVWGSPEEDGSPAHGSQTSTISGDSLAGQTVALSGLTWSVDMSNRLCEEFAYVCAEIRLESSADHTLLPQVILQCGPAVCEGIVIISEDFTFTASDIYEASTPQKLSTDVIHAEAANNGASITDGAARIWEVSLFLNSENDGSGQTFGTAVAPLTSAQEQQGVSSTVPLTFATPLEFTFNVEVMCGEALYVCLEIAERDVNPNYDITFPQLPVCDEVNCIGVVFTGAVLTAPGDVVLTENEPSQAVVLTFMASLASQTATLQTGRSFWRLSVFASGQPDGSGQRHGQVPAALSAGQETAPAVADGTVEMANVVASLNLADFFCPAGTVYLCAELQRHPDSDPSFTVQGTPDPLVACQAVECQGVLITGISIEGLPEAVVENQVNPLVLDVVAGIGGADASGTNLWQMNATLVDADGNVLELHEIDLGSQASADVTSGSTVTFNDLSIPFDLRGLVCPSSGSVQLCLELSRAGGADADFTVTGMTKNCTDVACLGVVINHSEVTASTGSLREGQFSNPITLSVSYWSSQDGASIIGTGLWSINVFGNDRESGLGPRIGQMIGTLQGNDADFPLAKGGTVDFNGVTASLSLFPSGVCQDVHWVCAELVKGTGAQPDFSLTDEDNARITCTNLVCNGVQILSTTLTIANSMLAEDSGEQIISLTSIMMVAGPDSSRLINDQDNFKVVVFGNSESDISGPRVAEAEAALIHGNFEINPGMTLALSGSATLNLTDVYCEDLQYICIRVYRGDLISRLYKLEGIPDANSLIDCTKVTCRGVLVTDASLDTTSILLEGRPSYSVEITANFDTDASGASVRLGGTDIFKMVAFLSGTADGSGEPKTEEQEVSLPQGSESQPVTAGGTISFTDAQAQLDTTDWTCQAQNFLCVRLLRDPRASFDYQLEGWDTVGMTVDNSLLQACTAINCRGVEITDVLFYNAAELSFRERDPAAGFTVDLGLVSDPAAGGVLGEGLWQLTASLNSAADGSGDDFGTAAPLVLSEANGAVGVDPTGPPANLTGLAVSLPGAVDIRCDQAADFYLCVQLERAPDSDPVFTLSPVEPSCTPIACHPVMIKELTLEVTTPAFILENQENALHVDLNVDMDETSADIAGTGLWASPAFLMRDARRTPVLPATGSYWGLTEQNKALSGGEMEKFENIFPVLVTPAGHICIQLKQLCMTLAKGANPDPEFSLEIAQGAEVCVDVECRGVEIISTVIMDIAQGDTVTERSADPQTITLTVDASSDAAAASIAGTQLWTLIVYYTPNADGSVDPVLGSTAASLTTVQENAGLDAGDSLLLEEAQTTNVDVSGLVCPEDELWLCARLDRQAASSPRFTLTGQDLDSLVGCRSITCIGVEFEETLITLSSDDRLIPVEKAPSHPVDFIFSMMTTDRTALLDGSNLWRFQLFANRRADGSNFRRSYEEDITLTQIQRDQDINIPGAVINFFDLSVDINLQLTDTECRDIAYLCGELLKGPSPTPEFSLQGNPTDSVLIDCAPMDCNGVKISTFELTNTGGSILRENQANQAFSFDASLTSAADKAAVSGENLWKFEVFLNDAPDCLGEARVGGVARGEVALTDANVRPGQEDQDLAAGGTLDFDVDVVMDYASKCPDWDRVFICLEVVIGDTSSVAFTLFGDVLKGAEIVCRGVEVTGTDVYSVNEGAEFVESDPSVTFDLTLRSTTVAEASGIAGTGLWAVDIYLSAEEDCAAASTDRVPAALTPANRDRAVAAGGVLSLSGVRATVPLDDALCDRLSYVCAVLRQGDGPVPDFTLVPKPDETALLASQAVECKGLHILSTSLTLREGEPMISGDPQHPVAFHFALATDPDGASVPDPTDLFRLQVAATDRPDGAGVAASAHQATLPFSPAAGIDVLAGQTIYLPVEATLDLSGARCDEVPYVCATLMKGLNPIPAFTLTPDGDSPVLTACSERLDCYGVIIAAESLTIDSGIPFKEHADSNPVELTVTLEADEVSSSAVGNDLWSAEVKLSLEDPLAADTQFLAATPASFVGGDEGAGLVRGGSVRLSLTASLDLTGISCSDVRYLVVNLTNVNADPEFTLEWRADGPEYVVVSKLFTCEGVSFVPGQLDVDFALQPLKELASTQEVQFTVSVDVTPNSAVVTGQDLWKVTAFVSADPNGEGTPEDEKAEAELTDAQGAVAIVASADSTLADVVVTLNTEGKDCPAMAHLCVEVWRGDSAQPYYNIESPEGQADLRICQPTLCNGVKIEAVDLSLAAEVPLIEMRPNQEVSVNAEVTAAADSAGIEGDNLWAATVFVNAEADGSGTRLSVREALIDPSQSSKDLVPEDGALSLEDLVATMDFTGIPCSQMAYLCVTLEEGDQAVPDFNLEDSDSLTKCIKTNCISVAIASNSLSLESNEVLQRDPLASFQLAAAFVPWPNSRSLQEDNSWQLFAYTADSGGGILALSEVELSQEQQDQAVVVGTPLAFDDLEVTLDVSGQTCATTTRFCLLLGTQQGVTFLLGGYPTRDSLIACADLICAPMDVELFATDVTENRIQVGFSEAFGDFSEYRISYSPPDGITTSPYLIPRNLARQHSFDQLVPGKEYTIQLDLVKGAVHKAGPFTLVQRTRPTPVDLKLVSITPSEMTISWDAATGVFDHYLVELDPQDSALPHTPLRVYPSGSGREQETFTGLLLARQYNVTVSTISGNQASLPSTIINNTAPATPDLQVFATGETTVDLIWFVNGDQYVDKYEVRYQPAGAAPQPLEFGRGSSGATLQGLTPGRRYDISLVAVSNLNGVQAIRSMADSEVTQTVPVPPEAITVTPSETDLLITWDSALGDKSHYTVSLSPAPALGEVTVNKDDRMVRFQNLQVASEYVVAVHTYVASANGMLVSRPALRTVYTLPNPPRALSVVQVTTSSIELQWEDAVGPRDGYEVTFSPNEPEFVPQSPAFTTSNSFELTGIKPHVTVDFEVRTKIGDTLSRPGTKRQRTFPTLPGQVEDFQIEGFDTDNILISFMAPEDPNGLIVAYLVTVDGTKPGKPSEEVFQTITALPNDVRFEEVISPLKAGYSYTLSIQAINTEGSGEPVRLDAVTLPIRDPEYTGGLVSIFDVTATTIMVRLPRALFSDRNGEVILYTILVVENGANQTAVALLPSYQGVANIFPKPVYQSLDPFNPFINSAGNGGQGRRRRRQAEETVDVIVGEETTCPSTGYCNGALTPVTQYRISVRAFTENGLYTDTPWSDIITTKFDPWWFVYAFIPFIIVILIIAFIMCLCTCIASDRRKPKGHKYQSREKQAIVVQQGNENASNNVLISSRSQEPLTPAPPPPKPSPTSRPVTLAKFSQHVRKMSTKTGDNFSKEFQDLNLIGENEAKTVGALPQNEEKNRYGNIIPYDYNRVRLNKDNDYINASLLSGFNRDPEYIAAQGPPANSVNDFWQMVWEQNVPVIAAIGSCVEKSRVKFSQYWPSNSTPITFGEVTVNRVSEREETAMGYTVRDFCLESGSEVRALRQFQFTAWPQHGVPKKTDQMLHFVRSVRTYLPLNAGPLLVHCGAGIGRTGVFIVLDILTQQVVLEEEYVDVFGTLVTKREERTNMVQTELQYEFVHRAVLDIVEGRVTDPNWTLRSKRRSSIDSDQRVQNTIAEAAL